MSNYAERWPNFTEENFLLKDYRFASGEVLPELRLHYRTMGMPRRDATGKIVNGVLLLQGNTGTGENWLRPSLADHLYGRGQPLDAREYFIIMQDAIGRGGSSKPSDGLKGNFPRYRYRDMVDSGYRFITEGLGVGHLRLVIGSSMGGMHCWLWAEAYPDLMDGVVAPPTAPQPQQYPKINLSERDQRVKMRPSWSQSERILSNPTVDPIASVDVVSSCGRRTAPTAFSVAFSTIRFLNSRGER